MTREEKEQTGKYVLQMARLLEDGCYQQEMLLKAVRIIDEALEQEPTTQSDCTEQNGCISCSLDDGDDCCRKLYEESMQEPKWLKSELIKLIDKTYEDFNNAPGGETWCKIDGKEYYSDMGYAFEGINMFVDVLKSRMENQWE